MYEETTETNLPTDHLHGFPLYSLGRGCEEIYHHIHLLELLVLIF